MGAAEEVSVDHYFAYGSNMNPARLGARGVPFADARSAWLPDMGLRFNKRATRHPHWGCANVVPAPGERVEGVLYRLADPAAILRLDRFEGTPVEYLRHLCRVETAAGPVEAWIYVAHPERVAEGLRPPRWYLEHLLAGRTHLSADYAARLSRVECHPEEGSGWP
ncbi:MAG: gamma-glutamylcyclotransferase [Porticoccaceae bacterium]|nr:MAG: gamma-glutamylcyclotransferase [Porticoccaceae bacterium]